MIKEYILKKSVETGFSVLKQAVEPSGASVAVKTEDQEAALSHHLAEVEAWCSEISFSDLRESKLTSRSFIPLSVQVTPRNRSLTGEIPQLLGLERLFSEPFRRIEHADEAQIDHVAESEERVPAFAHLVILGHPGAGKTTSMKHVCYRVLHDDKFAPDVFRLPILIRLREFRQKRNTAESGGDPGLLIPKIQRTLGIRISYPNELEGPGAAEQRFAVRNRAVVDVLEALRCLIVLDGFDEIVYKSHRDIILNEFRLLSAQLSRSMVVLTSRTGEYTAHVEGTNVFEIRPLDYRQIEDFAIKWLGPDDGVQLLSELNVSPFRDTAIRPLTLAHLCAIFERIGSIPERPKTVYRKIVHLLLEDWDEQRSVRRETQYAGFQSDRKFEFLSNLAFVLTTQQKGVFFSREDLLNAYEQIHENFGLPRGEADNVLAELEGHTGLFVQAGFEWFEFSHKSLQEYLTAEFLVKLPSIPRDRKIKQLANELAVAVAISSRPSAYFAELVTGRFADWSLGVAFLRTFVSRLLLERPDFERSEAVGLAALQLYSIYLNSWLRKDDQLYLFIMDELAGDFDALAGMIKDRIDLEQLLTAYDLRDRAEGADGFPVFRLTLRDRAANQRIDQLELLPELYIRPSLVEGTKAFYDVTFSPDNGR